MFWFRFPASYICLTDLPDEVLGLGEIREKEAKTRSVFDPVQPSSTAYAHVNVLRVQGPFEQVQA
jgi:hypothetical protein